MYITSYDCELLRVIMSMLVCLCIESSAKAVGAVSRNLRQSPRRLFDEHGACNTWSRLEPKLLRTKKLRLLYIYICGHVLYMFFVGVARERVLSRFSSHAFRKYIFWICASFNFSATLFLLIFCLLF